MAEDVTYPDKGTVTQALSMLKLLTPIKERLIFIEQCVLIFAFTRKEMGNDGYYAVRGEGLAALARVDQTIVRYRDAAAKGGDAGPLYARCADALSEASTHCRAVLEGVEA